MDLEMGLVAIDNQRNGLEELEDVRDYRICWPADRR